MKSNKKFTPDSNLRLMDQVRQVLRYHHYAYRTEENYRNWLLRFIKHNGGDKDPKDMGKSHIAHFIAHLATDLNVAASTRRHHVLESGLQTAVITAVQNAGIIKRVGCHTFQLSFTTHLMENGTNICVVQELMGHADVKTTEIYTHVMKKDIDDLASPLDLL